MFFKAEHYSTQALRPKYILPWGQMNVKFTIYDKYDDLSSKHGI